MADASFWDERYRRRPWPTDPDPLLVETVGALLAGRALDLGCGTGRHAIWLACRGWSVTGVDSSAVGLAQAAERVRSVGVELATPSTGCAPPCRPDWTSAGWSGSNAGTGTIPPTSTWQSSPTWSSRASQGGCCRAVRPCVQPG